MYPVQIASLLIAAILSSCAFCVTIDPATAGPIAGWSETADAAPKINPATISAAKASPVGPPPAAKLAVIAPAGRAYLFRGALGPIFSRGMDRLTKRIEEVGVTATVNEFTICRYIAAKAIRDYRQDPAPIILIGHSMGGFCAVKFAEILQAENIPVSLVVTIDPAHVTPDVPLNVERFINIFLAHNVLGGGDVVPAKGYQGHYASFDLSQHDEVTHINIDKMGSLHEQLVTKIQELSATSAKAEGEAIPIRYVVPADAGVELWDSGTPVFSHSGDTLETLAAYYRVPLWSLSQINQVPASAPLVDRQRIVIPRHLVALATVSGQPPPKR
jgi:hypothetical protein